MFWIGSIVLLILVGTLLEGLPALIILAPLLLPIATGFGIDAVQYGIVLILAMGVGAFMPPVGIGFYVAVGRCRQPGGGGGAVHGAVPGGSGAGGRVDRLGARHLARGAIADPRGRARRRLQLSAPGTNAYSTGPGHCREQNGDQIAAPLVLLCRKGSVATGGMAAKGTGSSGTILSGGEAVLAELNVVVGAAMSGKKALPMRADLNRCICRSRRRVGWCDTSARLLR